MARDALAWLARLGRRRYGWVFAGFLTAALVAAGLTASLEFDTDVLRLLPQEDPDVRLFLDTIQQFGTVDYLLVAVRVPEGAAVEPYENFVEGLGGRLRALPQFSDVRWGLGDPGKLVRDFLPKAMLFLDAPGRRAVTERLSDPAIRETVRELRRRISTPQGAALKEWLKLDPLGLAEVFLGSLRLSEGPLQADFASGFFLSRDHRLLLLVAKPTRPAQDIAFVRGMAEAVRAEVARASGDWRAEFAEPGDPPPPPVALGGGHMIALGDASLIQSEVTLNIASSLAGVLLLFWFAFRRWSALVFPLIPLVCGLLFTFGFGAAVYGSISSATSGVAALLIGLGIDFVIVCYGRYVEERNAGRDVLDALTVTARRSGWAIVVGATTTAATFYAFCVTDFRGLQQMGVLTGTGILFCMAAVLLLLPALLAWSEDRHARRERQPRLFIHGFGVERLMHWSQRHPRPTLLVAAAITLVLGAVAPGIGFQEAMAAMRPKGGSEGIRVQEEVGRHFGSGFEFMMLTLDGATPGEVVALADEAAARARELVGRGVLVGYDAVTSVLPPPQAQREAIDWLRAGRAAGGPLDLGRIQATFEAEAAAEGLRLEPFREGLSALGAALAADRPLSIEDFQGDAEGRRLIERYLQQRGEGWRGVVYLYPPLRRWKSQPPPETLALAADLGPRARLTGPNVVSATLRARVRVDAAIAAVLGLALVLVLLWMDYRELRGVLLSMLPLAVGLVWMFGTMSLLQIDMNFMNIFVTTMIIGIATDYGVHVVHRYRETRHLGEEEARSALAETGKAVLLAALTTVVGFGSLSLSRYPGLSSMGVVAALGTLYSCLASLTVLPAAFALRREAVRGAARPEVERD